MKNSTTRILLTLFLTCSTFGIFAQETPEVHSAVINFSDQVKYSEDHPSTIQNHIGNDATMQEEDEALPVLKVKDFTNIKKDPYGVMPTGTASKGNQPLLAPTPNINFNAIDDNNTTIPPDVHGAVGPAHIMTTLNSQYRIQNLTGGVILTLTMSAFWAPLSPTSLTDPRIAYDPFNNRWIACVDANPQSTTSAFFVAVSATSDPTGTWFLYSFDADAPNTFWLDFPTLAFNKDWITVTGNMFRVSNNVFNKAEVLAIKKSDLYANAASPSARLLSSTSWITISPATDYDNVLDHTMYFVMRVNGNSAGNGVMQLFKMTGAFGAEAVASVTQFSTPNTWSGSAAATNSAPQSGTTNKINNGDDRVQNVVYRNGNIWAVHNIFLPATSPTRSAIQWWEISTAGAIMQRSRIDDATAAIHYAYPSIAVNVNNDVVIGYSRFSTTTFASAAYANRLSTDPVNTLQSEFVYKQGLAPYFKTYGGTSNRWGDFSATVTDPSGTDFWTLQEYAMTPLGSLDRWGTWWAKVSTTPCTANPVSVSIAVNPTGPVCTGQSVTFTATPVNPGTTPTYQWLRNGVNAGTNSPTFTTTSLVTGDQISCVLYSNVNCPSGNPATSNSIGMTVSVVDDNNPCTNDFCNTSTAVVTHTLINVDDGDACTTDGCTSSVNTTTTTFSGATGLPLTWTSTTPSVPNFDVATLAVSGFPASAFITNLSAQVNLNHTWGGDMQLYLIHPNGSNFVAFVNDITDSHLEFGSNAGAGPSLPYQFTSTGATMTILATASTANVIASPGPYKPVDGNGSVTTFGTFNNLAPNGTWQLLIGDGVTGDGGSVSLLSVTITAQNYVATITHTPVNTDDGNACTTDGCNSISGVFHNPVNTDDGNVCTTDGCDSSTGVFHNPVSTDDGNVCTTDGCDSSTGVFHNPVSTDDGNACTTDGCDSSTGIFHNPVSTDDGNACTTDGCDSSTGIFHNPVSTDDGNACTTDDCDTQSGTISHTPVNIDDGNPCTTDACDSQTGTISHIVIPNCGGCANPPTADAGGSYNGCGNVQLNGSVGGGATSGTWSSLTGGTFFPNANTLNAIYQPSALDLSNGSATVTLTSDNPAGNPCVAAVNNATITFTAVDDNNVCTTDACNTSTGNVSHTPVTVDDGNACTTDGCDSSTGVFHNPVSTDDGNACTTDGCDTSTGVFHNPVSTDDGNACTTDGCDSSTGVFHNPVTTDDGNACTTDGCDSSTGVFHNPVSTDDGNACTTDGCDSSTGVFHNPVSTDDGNACTTDGCDTSTGVFHNPVSTDDGNACTTDGCNTSTGVFHNPVNTNDGDACTTDGCNTLTGIFHNPVDIDDNNECTTDGCNSVTGVFHTPAIIDDGNACTTDACDTQSGLITHTPVTPVDDGNACTLDVCVSSSSTNTLFLETFDGTGGGGSAGSYLFPAGWSLFNVDGQTAVIGLFNVDGDAWERYPVLSGDSAAISTSWIDPAGQVDRWMVTPAITTGSNSTLSWDGLAYDPNFPDGYEVRLFTSPPTFGNLNSSTLLLSVPAEDATGYNSRTLSLAAYQNQTVYIGFRNNSVDEYVLAIDNVSVVNSVTGGSTTHIPVSTDDGNACTIDGCNTLTGVFHNPVSTDDGNACTTDACNTSTGAITHTTVNVDDGNACTTDGCNTSTGAITHTAVNTDDGNACTTDACNPSTGAITHTAVNTDDGNACTTDACNTSTGAITHTNVSVDDGNACTTDACNPSTGAITHTAVNTDDGNACTTDACNTSTGAITHTNVSVDDGNACTTDACNPSTGAITHTAVNIDDGNACTTDACNTTTGAITHTPVSVDDNNPCTADACNTLTGVITHTPIPCGVDLYSNILLEAYYLGGGLMSNPLFISGVTSNPSNSDLITISAMQAAPPHGLVDSKTDTLHTNGNVHVKFGPAVIAGNSYYLRITHRNHIETWSANPVVLNSTTTYSFSDSPAKAFSSNETFTHLAPGGLTGDGFGYALYCGDLTGEGSVDATDFLDLDPHIQNGDSGYIPEDINGDGVVDATDFLWLDPNVQNGVGSNTP